MVALILSVAMLTSFTPVTLFVDNGRQLQRRKLCALLDYLACDLYLHLRWAQARMGARNTYQITSQITRL